jgi:hypothetical protein
MKVTKKTHLAVLIFWDEELDEPRRVMFGQPESVIDLINNNIPLILSNLIRFNGLHSEESFVKQMESMEPVGIRHNAAAYKNAHITISYEVKGENSGKRN